MLPTRSPLKASHFRPTRTTLPLVAACLATVLALPTPAIAKSSFGLAVVESSQPYRSYSSDTVVAPIINWEGEHFYFRGTGLGYKLIERQSSTLSLTASPMLYRFRPEDSSDWRMKQLDDRGFLATAGIDWSLTGSWGTFTTKAEAEITGTGGFIAEAKYSYPISAGHLVVLPEVGASYQSEEITQHYYQVSQAESTRSGLAAYAPGDSVSPYLGVTVILPLSQRWAASVGLRRTLLSDSISDSPMVNSDHQDSASLALSLNF